MKSNNNIFGAAQWISAPHNLCINGNPGSAATYFVKHFFVDTIEGKSSLLICGLGLYEVQINGKKVGRRVLSSAFTNYDKSVIYDRYDVSKYLLQGSNQIVVILADGWYNQQIEDVWNFYKAPWRDVNKLLLQLTINNKRQYVYSDESWIYSQRGPICFSAIRLGEYCDYNQVLDFKFGSDFAPVIAASAPRGKLKSVRMPKIAECEYFEPQTVTQNKDGFLIDFGQNIAGYVILDYQGVVGQTITLNYGDRLTDGLIDNKSNAQYLKTDLPYQTDTFVLDGIFAVHKPKFVYHGFQYVQIGGICDIGSAKIKAALIHTDFKRTGNFACSDDMLNQIYQMSIYSALSNYHGFPTDCPHREKNGWTGDMQLSADFFLMHFQMESTIEKWLNDILDSQLETGKIPCIVPTGGWGYDWGSGPAWDFAFISLPWHLQHYYGNSNAIKKTYGGIQKYLSYLDSRANGGLLEIGLGDWNYPLKITFPICPTKLTDSCYYFEMNKTAAEFAETLGYTSQKEFYTAKAEHIRLAIIKEFVDDNGNVANNAMTALAAILFFNIVDGRLYRKIFKRLIAAIEQSDYRYNAGILGVKYINNVLAREGKSDVVVQILKGRAYPSIGYWISKGATTLWEDWEGTNSLNHHMFCDVSAVMLKYLGGIQVGDKAQGYDIVIAPNTAGCLTWCNAKTMLCSHIIEIAWTLVNGNFSIIITTSKTCRYKLIMPNGIIHEGSGSNQYQCVL